MNRRALLTSAAAGVTVASVAPAEAEAETQAPHAPNDERHLDTASGRRVLTSQADAGTVDWSVDLDGAVRAGASVVDGTVFVGDGGGAVHALDAASGDRERRYGTGETVRSTPAVDEPLLYVGCDDGRIYTLDVEGGDAPFDADEFGERSPFETGGPVRSSPTLVPTRDPETATDALHAVVGSDDGTVRAIDAGTPTTVWETDLGDPVRTSTPMSDTVYFGDDGGTVTALDSSDGTVQWVVETDGAVRSSAARADDRVLVGSDGGTLYAITPSGKIDWTYATNGPSRSSPTVAAGTVVVGSDDGYVHAVDAETGERGWRVETGDRVRAAPTVAGGTVYAAGDDGVVRALALSDGSERWTLGLDAAVRSAPIVADGRLLLGTDDGRFHAVGVGAGTVPTDDGERDDRETSGAWSDGSRVRLRTLGHHDRSATEPPSDDSPLGWEVAVVLLLFGGIGYLVWTWPHRPRDGQVDPPSRET
ncbi:outer membrane protein assembly factor BamB family protein [Haloparvum sedimenti]|uniref:outer membrane protein assembly factor BamB family protein n=1 Tax=Haloparvum sedimenti TaxID=1678448 RepID=UPI00071E7663|nr:PQQ-binding-like beta-propeller repeat protein [Haloparvum sedimenti]